MGASKFLLDTDKLLNISEEYLNLSKQIESEKSLISSVTFESDEYDLNSAIKSIVENIDFAIEKVSNSSKLINTVISQHNEIQNNTKLEDTAICTIYTAQKGDWLSKIAIKYGITVDELAKYNDIKNEDDLKVGQQILIPESAFKNNKVNFGNSNTNIFTAAAATTAGVAVNAATTGTYSQQTSVESSSTEVTMNTNGVKASSTSFQSLPFTGGYTITSNFGEQRPGHKHGGLDIVLPGGTNADIVSATSGKVIRAQRNPNNSSGYGIHVYVQTPDGYIVRYGHLSSINSNIVEGATITAGMNLGKQGSTGRSSGNHLHFEIRNSSGVAVNPRDFYDLKVAV